MNPSNTPLTPPPAESPAARFQRVMDVFLMAVDLDAPGRERVIAQEFQSDPDLAAEVRAMLAAEPPADAPGSTGAAGSFGSSDLATGAGLRLGADAAHAELAELEREAAAALRTLPVISGHYRILRTLGEGGMGVVYLAEQDVPRRLVALKAIRAGLASRSVLTRFIREANILGRLQHPGIAQIYECGVLEADESGRAFIVLEYVDGPTITRFAADHRLDEAETLRLLAEVCDAVHHAHLRGVIHRDLKPGNILVEPPGAGTARAKVLDFGVARLEATDGPHGPGALSVAHLGGSIGHAVVGTPGYMSPEQLDGDAQAVDATSDVYALGVILYELLAGRRAFDVAGKPLAEAARLVRFTTPCRIDTLSRARRTDLETIIAKAIHPDRSRRYQSAAALADDLRAAAALQPIAARRDSAFYVLGRLASRHKVIVTLVALLVLGGLAFAIIAGALAGHNARLASEAQAARSVAEAQTAKAQALNEQLETELSAARIDRGRAEAKAGRLRLAEDPLWRESIANPSSQPARWALAELYQRIPVQWTRQAAGHPTSMCVVRAAGGPLILIGDASGSIDALDARGEPAFSLGSIGARITSLAALAGGRALITLSDGRAAIIDAAPGARPTFLTLSPDGAPGILHPRGIRDVAVSADGRTIALAGADRRLSIWRLEPFADAPTNIATIAPYSDAIHALALNRDGSLLACFGVDAQTIGLTQPAAIHLYTVADMPDPHRRAAGTRTMPRDVEGNARRLAFASIGESTSAREMLVIGRRDFAVSLLDPDTLEERLLPSRLTAVSQHLCASPDASTVLISCEQTLSLLDVASGLITPRFQSETGALAGAWIDDRTWVTLNAAGVVRAAGISPDPALTRLTQFTNWCFATAFSPDGRTLAITAYEGFIALHDARSLRRVGAIPIPSGTRIRGLAWLQDSDTLILGCQDGRIRIACAASESTLREHRVAASEIYGLAVDPQERFVAIGQWNPVLRVLDLHTGRPVADLPKPDRRVEGIAFSPDGSTMVNSGYADKIQLWNTADWSAAESVPTSATPWSVAFSADGQSLLVSTYDGTVDAFAFNASRPIGSRITRRGSIRAHQSLIPGLAVSQDGRMFATGSEDGALKLWHTQSLRNLLTTDPAAGFVISVAFNPSGTKLATANASNVGAVLDLDAIFAPVEAQRAFHAERLAHDPDPAR